MTIDTPRDWFTEKNTCYLIGAGCSFCAGKPLMGTLTQKVVDGFGDKKLADHMKSLQTSSRTKATIEDFMTNLIQMKSVVDSISAKDFGGWKSEEIAKAIEQTKRLIIEEIGYDWKSNAEHERFLQSLAGVSKNIPTDIFCLNYDVVIESSLESSDLTYTDGFRGAENAFFDADLLASTEVAFRLYKLHGSINWVRDVNDKVRRRPKSGINAIDDRHVIYPSEQKYIQTQFGVYEILLQKFRDRLRDKDLENNRLIVLGYSFGDEHINHAISDSLSQNKNLSLFAFVGENSVNPSKKALLESISKNNSGQVNFFVGKKEYIGESFENSEIERIFNKYDDLSKFETVVNLMA